MIKTSSPRNRSALKQDPLHEPGQSLHEQLVDVIVEDVMLWSILAIMAGVFTMYEWLRYFADMGYHPVAMTVVSAPFIAYVVYRIRKTTGKIKRLKSGLRGERLAGQFLQNELMPLGFKVVHDLVEDGYNIDHIVVGPKGVFAIETKAFSKPGDGEAAIIIDGEEVLVNGYRPDRNPIQQAEAIADRVQKLLPKLQRGPVKVQPVVLLGGWKVERRRKPRRTWVVNFTGLSSFLEREPDVLSGDEINHLSDYLADHQRRSDALNP